MHLTMKDGARLTVHAKADDHGEYYDVAEPGGTRLGTIRLLTGGKTECHMKVPTADAYFAETVQQLRSRGL